MRFLNSKPLARRHFCLHISQRMVRLQIRICSALQSFGKKFELNSAGESERGDVPGWVLVVLMTTGLVTAIWTIAAPRLTAILRNSLDSMNGIR